MAWPSPAKINLFLHVTAQRNDGYHEIQTVFQFLDYCDSLEFQIEQSTTLELLTPVKGVKNESNIILRAAKCLQSHTKSPQGAKISIKKRLPIGGGLGGGSSNAATTLIALNHLWKTKLTTNELAQLGLTLGADVPVFIHGYAAWAEGVGEELTPILPAEPWYVIIVPDCQVSTAEVFSSQELTRDCEPITISRFLTGEGENICEGVVLKSYPAISQAVDWLNCYGKSRMSGTGACIFADFSSQVQAQQVLDNLPQNWQGFIAKGCNQSPLATLMDLRN